MAFFFFHVSDDNTKECSGLPFPSPVDYDKAFDCVDHNILWKILKEMGIPDHLTCLLRCLLLGRKVMTNLDSILKSRDISLSTKVHLVKATVFPVVMYGCESSSIKKAEHRRIDAFDLWCWRRLLRVPWTARRSHQSILEISIPGDQPWDFFGRNDTKAETPVLWPPHAKSWLIGKDSDAGRDWGQEEKGTTEDEMVGWHHRLNGHGFG